MEEATKVPFLKKITPYDKDGVANVVRFVLGNGQTVEVNRGEVSPANWEHAAIHGISQRLGDSCSAFSKDSNFAEAYESLVALKAQLATDEWNREREGGSERKQAYTDLVAALVRMKKQDEEVVRAAVDRASPEKLKKWMANADVKAEIAEIRAKRLKKAAKGAGGIDEINLDD